MNQCKQQKNITISVRDLELGQIEDKPNLNDISCYLTVFTEENETKNKSNKCFDMLILSDPLNSAKFKIIEGVKQYLKVQLKTYSQQKLIGGISIDLSIFAESNNLQLDQWVNLIVSDNEDQSPNNQAESQQKKNQEGFIRLKMRFSVNNLEETIQTQEELEIKNEQFNNEKNILLNTTIQPCVNFPTSDKKSKEENNQKREGINLDVQKEELVQIKQKQQNFESRLVLTPERRQTQENSFLFQNKFQELIEKLMETRNQSLILGVTRQLNENNNRELEKNTLTDILKRLNESHVYLEDDQIQNPEQDFNNINISLSSIHQGCKKQASPEPTKRNRYDLEGEIASLRLELEKKQEFEQAAKDLKIQLFRQERDNQSLLNQYNKAVDNYQKYFTELNDENHKLKQKIAQKEKEVHQKETLYQELKAQFDEQLKAEKLKLQSALIQESIMNTDDIMNKLNKDELNSDKIQSILMKHKQEITQYSQMLVEAQNESVEYQAKMQQMQKEIEELQQKLVSQTSSQNILFSNAANNKKQVEETNKNQANSIIKQISEDDQAYLQKLIKDKTIRIAQLEDEKTKAEYINEKSDNTIKQLKEKINSLQKQLEKAFSNKQNDFEQILEENIKLKTQIQESEQLNQALENHLKTKQDEQKTEEQQQKKVYNTNEINNVNRYKIYNHLQHTLKFNQQDQQEQIKILVEELEQKITFIGELNYLNKDYKVQIQTLQEKVKILEFNSNEVEQLKKNYRDLQQEKEKINSDLYAITEDLLKKTTECISQKSYITQLSNESKRLEKIIEDLLLKNPSSQFNQCSKKGEDEVELKLQEFLSNNVTPIKFVRIEEGIYSFGTKRIIVKILKGKLNCRVGCGFMAIEEFLQLYTLQELIKMKQSGDFSSLNYPISEEKIDELILQDIQYNQLQFKNVQESQNNHNSNKVQTLPSKIQKDTTANYIRTCQPVQQNFNYQNITNNNNKQNNANSLKNSQLINQAIPCTQQEYQYSQIIDNNQSSLNNNSSLIHSNNTLNVSPRANKSCEMVSNQSFDNLNIAHLSNNNINFTQPNIDYKLISLKTDHSCDRRNISSVMIKPFVISQPQPSTHNQIYNNHIIHDISNSQILVKSDQNQEIMRLVRGLSKNDAPKRNDTDQNQQIIQLAGYIKNNEPIRRYSLSSQNGFNGQQQIIGNQNQNTFNINLANSHKNFQQQPQQYPIDYQNVNQNHHVLNPRNQIQNGNLQYNKANNAQLQSHPTSYSVRATPQKQSRAFDNSSVNTCVNNTPQQTNSQTATPKRNDMTASTYQERILKSQSHKRNIAEELSPYSHNRYSSNNQAFQAQPNTFYIHK